jgi:tetratricopeptide (TPR) repeat protein
VACLERCVQLQPDFPEAHNNLGNAHRDQGRLEEAHACFARALELRPDYADAHWNRALLWLLQGDFEKGLPEYEWRWQLKDFRRRAHSQPLWNGAPLGEQTLLLYAEQGLGDTVQFIRYAALARRHCGRIVVQCQPPLARLLAGYPGVDQLVPEGVPLPPFDAHAPLLSLPRLLGTTLDTIPANIPYLHADPGLVALWRDELASGAGFKVGIAWQGSTKYRADRWRSMPLAQFEPLARVPGVRLFSLQKGFGREQVHGAGFPVTDLGGRLDEAHGAFMDTAAVLKNLDLVITSDTVIAHLAGALGVPVWVAVPFLPDWRWLLEREDSPWYPTMRLFRQAQPGRWDEVFQLLAEALGQHVGQGHSDQLSAITSLTPAH